MDFLYLWSFVQTKFQLGLVLCHRGLLNPKLIQFLVFQTFSETIREFFIIGKKLLSLDNITQNSDSLSSLSKIGEVIQVLTGKCKDTHLEKCMSRPD